MGVADEPGPLGGLASSWANGGSGKDEAESTGMRGGGMDRMVGGRSEGFGGTPNEGPAWRIMEPSIHADDPLCDSSLYK